MTTPLLVKTIAPVYAGETDETLQVWLDLAAARMDAASFGALYAQANAYLAAHLLTVARRSVPAQAGSGSGGGTGATGAIDSVSTGDWSISFGGSLTGAETGDVLAESSLMTTAFGKEFLAIRRTRAASRSRIIRPR